MDIFQELELSIDKLHPKYKIIKKQLSFSGEQDILKDWAHGFQDRDGKFVKEFQTTFHSSFWELYLFAVFKEAGFKIDFSKNRPDFIVCEPYNIYIEAVTSNIKQDGQKEEKRSFDDVLSMLDPPHLQRDFYEKLDESIVRHSNAILGKSFKYIKEYSELEYIGSEVPYVIALGGFDQINYGNQFYFPLMALLYGKYYDTATDEFKNKSSINKPNSESDILIGLFNNKTLEHVSAIVFSSTVTLGKITSLAVSKNKSPFKPNFVINIRVDSEIPKYKMQVVSEDNPEYLSDGLFVFHNPFAKNKLPIEVFNKTNATQLSRNSDGFVFLGNNLPIFARLNHFPNTPVIVNSLVVEAFNKFNSNDHVSISF